jgi:HSP20 family protein
MQLALRTLRPSAVSAARLSAARPRSMMAMPTRRLNSAAVRAQAEEEPKNDVPAAAPAPAGSSALAPRASWEMMPSWSRMNQMMKQMEVEMEQLSRAFGMPSVFSPSASLFDMPAADLPAAMPAMAKSLAVDVKDTGNALEIHADVPGMSKDDIKVQVSPDRVLSISGERKEERRERSEEGGSLRVERSFGSFMRRFRLPDNVDVEGIKATTRDGVLTVTVPKTEEPKPKSIEVSVE